MKLRKCIFIFIFGLLLGILGSNIYNNIIIDNVSAFVVIDGSEIPEDVISIDVNRKGYYTIFSLTDEKLYK